MPRLSRHENRTKDGEKERMLMKSKASLPRPLMATLSSLCLLSKPLSFLPSNPNPNPRFPMYKSFANTCSSSCSRDASLSEMKSIGEIFHGLASMHFKTRNLTSQSGGREDLKEEAHVSGGPEGIASVVQDSVQSDVIWEQRSKDVAAESEKKKVTSPGFSFSAAGMLLPYHLGVAQLLIEKGYIKETTPLAGSSAGAIVSVAIGSGNSMQDALKFTKILAEDCRINGTAFRLGAVLRDFLDKFLPDDIHKRSNGRVRVAITQILWRPSRLLVDQFDSKEDLINAVFTSSFIPGYLAPRPATVFRNRLCIDGGLTLLMPPTSASQTVRVCPFPASRLKLEGIGISPDCNQNNRATPHQLLKWALEPAEDDILDKFFELGYLDAEVWAKQNPVETTLHDDENASSP